MWISGKREDFETVKTLPLNMALKFWAYFRQSKVLRK
jgi:hypothetical protein